MFATENQIRMHDIDMVGILYFPRQFRLVHEALEDFLESEGFGFDQVLKEEQFLFVIVHCSSDYIASLRLGDRLRLHVWVGHIGTTSFTIEYAIYKREGDLVGKAKTVHVSLDFHTREKIPIPESLKHILQKHLKS